MLARYYGDLWRQRLDLDTDQEAVGLVELVDELSGDSMALASNVIRSFLRASSSQSN